MRINNIRNYQKIENYESRTPAGEYCLWICADDEKVKPEEEEKEEYHQWKHYARIKRIAVDAQKCPNMSEDKEYANEDKCLIQDEIKYIEKKRNHYFDIEA